MKWFLVKIYTVEPPKRGHFGEMAFVPCREVVPISEIPLFFSLHHPNTCIFFVLVFMCSSFYDMLSIAPCIQCSHNSTLLLYFLQFSSQEMNSHPDIQCGYQAPDPCNPSNTPVDCCDRGGAPTLAANVLFVVALFAVACVLF